LRQFLNAGVTAEDRLAGFKSYMRICPSCAGGACCHAALQWAND